MKKGNVKILLADDHPLMRDGVKAVFETEPGYELVDWGGITHMGGGSHGALDREDSLSPLLMVGLEGEPGTREQWSLRDVLGLVLDHFGIPEDRATIA